MTTTTTQNSQSSSNATQPEVLVVGITGNLGARIAGALLDRGEVRVRALVRPGSQNKPGVPELVQRGVQLVEGDILDPATLPAAVQGVSAVISAVNNEEALIVTGQQNLLRAAAAAGVRRFIPSDFSVDYRELTLGDNRNLDMRMRFLPILQASGVPYTLVLQGAFTEVLMSPFMGLIDPQAGTYSFWGDLDMKMDFTTMDDTARYVAAAALDPRVADQALEVAGDQITHREIMDAYAAASGRTLTPRRLGSADELKAWITARQATARHFMEYLPAQYQWAMASGKGKLRDVRNDLYPDIRPTPVREFLSAVLRGGPRPTGA